MQRTPPPPPLAHSVCPVFALVLPPPLHSFLSTMPAAASASTAPTKGSVIWVDGCFDMMHFGHANAMRQARALGTQLIVGVHSDEDIAHHKGPTVMQERERYEAVRGCKWVDRVVEASPYVTELEVVEAEGADWVAHGDDITSSADGRDTYWRVKEAGKYIEFKRTEGVSTTDLVGRMLLCTREHFTKPVDDDQESILGMSSLAATQLQDFAAASCGIPATRVSHYRPKSKTISPLFPEGGPAPGARIVLVSGAFDLFHVGHIRFLERARALGDYLVVAVQDDQTVNRIKGNNMPIMNLYERTLGVLSCRFVDEVIIGAPYSVDDVVLEHFKDVGGVAVVAHGQTDTIPDVDGSDPYATARERGIFQRVLAPAGKDAIDVELSAVTSEDVIRRIINRRSVYEERNRRKDQKAAVEEQLLSAQNQS
ncbi:hypothetical protein H696_00723 [Fonticula alba]|uniref:ethanolamine-phosphate cytidylyltransferase n=1 Tax=Fonticula alba TaxID=691883 RepID=A0A058ZFL5_FONAL|nr:hypothetical protein H696_00723 [Fonticula alba]KCV73180.1 hypothetical protein H696_00723 [Fonticula alba]|eukprot:XP_009492881.1 hypothetical protein H696_00723 [Fonticula alba]